LKPVVKASPGWRSVFHGGAKAVSRFPLWVQVPFQPSVSRWPAVNVMVSDHERRGAGPRFVIVAEAVKPFGQECSIAKWTEQVGRLGAVVGALPEPAAEVGALVRLRSVDGGIAGVGVGFSETGLVV